MISDLCLLQLFFKNNKKTSKRMLDNKKLYCYALSHFTPARITIN